MNIEIKGLDELRYKVAQMGADFDAANEQAAWQSAKEVQGVAKLLCQVDTGELRDSIGARIEAQANSATGTVYTNKEHGPYIEFGTGQRGDQSVAHRHDWAGMEPQPFMYPALEQTRNNIVANYKRRILEAAMKQKAGGGGG